MQLKREVSTVCSRIFEFYCMKIDTYYPMCSHNCFRFPFEKSEMGISLEKFMFSLKDIS